MKDCLGYALRATTVLLFFAACAQAQSQMIPCRGVGEPGLKLLLDEVVSVGGNEAVMLALRQRVDAGLMQIELEAGSKVGTASVKRVRVIRCPKRRPGGSSDFDDTTVRELNNNQVVMEVWGTTASAARPGGGHDAAVGYVLVPIRYWESTDIAPGVVEFARQVKAVESVEDLLAVLDQSGRLAAYNAAASGVRLFRERNYDHARVQLCSAQAKLERLQTENFADDRQLLDYVSALAKETVTKAQSDKDYHGSLRALSVTRCQLPTP